MLSGKPAPEISLLNQDGKLLNLNDFSDRTVVLFAFPKAATSG